MTIAQLNEFKSDISKWEKILEESQDFSETSHDWDMYDYMLDKISNIKFKFDEFEKMING